jgi:Flp pilus assembly protein TadD
MQPPDDTSLGAVGPAARLYGEGRLVEARKACAEVLESDPRNAHALHLRGLIANEQGDIAAGIEALEAALRLGHSEATLLNNLGELYRTQERFDEAEASYRKALELKPEYLEAGANLGALLWATGKMERTAPNHLRVGLALQRSGRHGEAVQIFRQALSLRPESPGDRQQLALVMERLGLLEDAAGELRTALELDPGFVEAHHDLGSMLFRLGRFDEAERSYRKALALRPEFALTKFALAALFLFRGDYAAGWLLYESRFEGSDQRNEPAFHAQASQFRSEDRWRGESLAGQTLLVWSEQGLGDNLMAARYLPLVKQRGPGRLLVYCERALVRLFRAMECADEVIARDEQPSVSGFDRHCPLMSLPLLFDTRLDTIPRAVPYFRVPPTLGGKWAERLGAIPAPRVGLVWAGGRLFRSNPLRTRSVAPELLAPIIGVEGVSFVSLQKNDGEERSRYVHRKIHDWMDDCGDLLDTAALIEQLDLVISVDTSVAHISGAMGKPVWMLNRLEGEWRWLLDREDSPWYPTMRVFRQASAGDWSVPIGQVAQALKEFVAPRRPRSWLKRLFA